MKSSIIIIVFFIGETIANLNPRIREEKYIGTLEDYDICLNDLSFYSTKENSKIEIILCGNSHYSYCITDRFMLQSNTTFFSKTFYYGITNQEKIHIEQTTGLQQSINNHIFIDCRNSLINYYNLEIFKTENNTIIFNDLEKRNGIFQCISGCIDNGRKTYNREVILSKCKYPDNNFEIVVIFLSIFGVILLISIFIALWKYCLSNIKCNCNFKLKCQLKQPSLPIQRIELTTINNPSINRLILNQKIIEKKDNKPPIIPNKVRNNSISKLV